MGKSKDDPIAVEAGKAVREKFHLPGFRFSDEENFDDLKNRAGAALKHLAEQPEESILVVTHGLFMRIVIAYALFGEKLTGEECVKFLRAFHMENTGITILGYDEKYPVSPWWLWVWNDHAHLG